MYLAGLFLARHIPGADRTHLPLSWVHRIGFADEDLELQEKGGSGVGSKFDV